MVRHTLKILQHLIFKVCLTISGSSEQKSGHVSQDEYVTILTITIPSMTIQSIVIQEVYFLEKAPS